MSNPIVTKLEIVQDLGREDAIAKLQSDLEKASKERPDTILKKYIVVVSTGDFIGMVSDKSKEILGAQSNVIVDKPLMNVPLEEIPAKFLKDYQFAIKKDSNLTEEEVAKMAQDKATEILKQKDNKTIPVVRILNIKENKDGQIVVPKIFGADFFDTNSEQVKTKHNTKELDDQDVNAAIHKALVALKNRGVVVDDLNVVKEQVEVAIKKAVNVVKIATASAKAVFGALQENGVDKLDAKMIAERIEQEIKRRGNIVGIDGIIGDTIESVVKDEEKQEQLTDAITKKITGIASVITQKKGVNSKSDAKQKDEITGDNQPNRDTHKNKLIEVAKRIVEGIKEGVPTLGYELSEQTMTSLVNTVYKGVTSKQPDTELNMNVYNVLVADENVESKDAEELTLAIATIIDERKVVDFENAKYDISDELKQMIFHMANEEKLAMELYNIAKELYPEEKVFNIGEFAERKHMETAEAMAKKYGFNTEDFEKLPEGKYSDEKVQGLFDALVTKIKTSKIDALQVGAMVEVVDSTDIENLIALAKKEGAKDVEKVYSNLVNASHQHYWSFDKALKENGVKEGAASAGDEYVKTEEEYPKAFSVKENQQTNKNNQEQQVETKEGNNQEATSKETKEEQPTQQKASTTNTQKQ